MKGTFDAFVSVGMLEHVGRRDYGTLARAISRTVRDGGRGLLHFIGRDAPRPLNPWIRRRIFPGAYTPTLGEVTNQVLMPAGMSVLDVENLRLHYAGRCGTGPNALRGLGTRCASDTARSSAARGSCTWRVGGRVRHRQHAIVPGGIRPVRIRAAVLDPRGDLRGRQASQWFTAMR